MAKAENTTLTPALTEAGLRKVIPRLQGDLVRVRASTRVSQDVKDRTVALVDHLTRALQLAAEIVGTGGDPGDWVAIVSRQFAELTGYIRSALDLGAGATGSCLYTTPTSGDKCIQCTAEQCADLGGLFRADTPCPP